MKAKEGDWVRFYRAGNLVIGVVQYVKMEFCYEYYQTDTGTVREDSVLEVRQSKK